MYIYTCLLNNSNSLRQKSIYSWLTTGSLILKSTMSNTSFDVISIQLDIHDGIRICKLGQNLHFSNLSVFHWKCMNGLCVKSIRVVFSLSLSLRDSPIPPGESSFYMIKMWFLSITKKQLS